MTPETIRYLLDMLDAQHAHISAQRRRSKAAAERQRIYYTGMYTAVSAAISAAYTQGVCVHLTHDGKHSVESCPALR